MDKLDKISCSSFGEIAFYDVDEGGKHLGVIVKQNGKFTIYNSSHDSKFFNDLYEESPQDFTNGYNIEDMRYVIILSTYDSFEAAHNAVLQGMFGEVGLCLH